MSRDIMSLPAPSADLRLRYGQEAYQFGDLRLPAGRGPHPVAVVIHGGYWRPTYGLDYMGHVSAALTAAGFATWNIEYRRLGNRGGGWPGTFLDVAHAADYLRSLVVKHQLDLTRVVTIGHSAGGHLACWLAARQRIPASSPLAVPGALPIRAVVSLAGVVDLRRAWELRLSRGVVKQLLGGTPKKQSERYSVASPYDLLPLGMHQLLFHGSDDRNVPLEISQRYAAAACERGDAAELITFPGAGHFELVDPRSREWPAIQEAMLALVQQS